MTRSRHSSRRRKRRGHNFWLRHHGSAVAVGRLYRSPTARAFMAVGRSMGRFRMVATGTEPNQQGAFCCMVESPYCNRRGGTAFMSNMPNCGPTAPRATGEPDPIFAAIERLRAARRGWLAAYDRLGVLQEM